MARTRLSSRSWGIVAAACIASGPGPANAQPAQRAAQAPATAQASTPRNQTELLRGANMWAAKNRTDLARQMIDKFLLDDRYSPVGLASLGELALRENKTEEAQNILDTLRLQHPKNRFTRELEVLMRVYGPEREKLSQMRLMARAGRMDEAAQMARTLFPAGPPTIGGLALEYFQIVGNVPGGGAQAQTQLQSLYRQTGESRYQLALLDMQLSQGASVQGILPSLESLAEQPDVDAPALQSLWRRALAKQGDNAAGTRSAQLFLARFPDDKAVAERLAGVKPLPALPAQRTRSQIEVAPAAPIPVTRTASPEGATSPKQPVVVPRERAAAPPKQVSSSQTPDSSPRLSESESPTPTATVQVSDADQQARTTELLRLKAEIESRDAESRTRTAALEARDAAIQALDEGNMGLAEDKLKNALALQPPDADSIGTLGLIRLRQEKYTEAQTLFGRAFSLSQQEKWTQLQTTAQFANFLRQADLALEKKQLESANTLARQALALKPESPDALNILAGTLVLQNSLPEAQLTYEKSLQYEADNNSTLKALARLYARGGDISKGLALLGRAAATDSALASKLAGTRVDLLKDQAKGLQAKDPEAALQALEMAISLDPDDPWLRHSAAQLYVRVNQPEKAAKVMDDGIGRAPKAASMRYARALIRSTLDDEKGVLSDMEAIAPSERSEGMQELIQRTVVNQRINQSNMALKEGAADLSLRQAEALARDDGGLLYSVANAWFKRGQPARGLEIYDRLAQRLVALPPGAQLDYAALLHRAQKDDAVAKRLPVLLALPKWDGAQEAQLLALYGDHQERVIERLQAAGNRGQALQIARAPLPQVNSTGDAADSDQARRRVQAQLLAAVGEYGPAITLLQPLVEKSPDDIALRLALGNALSRQGRHQEATVQAMWLEEHLPSADTSKQLSLLRLWQRSGQISEAREVSSRLLKSSPADTDVLLHSARLERADRQYAQARTLFQRAWTQEARSAGFAIVDATTEGSRPESLQTGSKVAPWSESTNIARYASQPVAQSASLVMPGSDPAAAHTGNAELDKIALEINAIEARRQAWVEGGQQTLQKSATEGISSLRGWERPMVAWIPSGYDGRYFLHVDQVHLDAGNLPSDRDDAREYGQVAAWPQNAYRVGGERQSNSGANLGVGYVGDTLEWDIGATGVGFPVTNLVGGISHGDSNDRFGYRVAASRRPFTGNLMTYAGARDPITGDVWGGVVATGVSARASTDIADYSTSLSASYDVLTGKNVRSKTRLQMRAAADRNVWESKNSKVNLGLALFASRFEHDLSEFSWGHGGYYSPRSYLSVALPVEWSGRSGALTWLVRAALSVSRSSSRPTDFFPGNERLQRQARNLGGQSVYPGSSSTEIGRSLRGAVEYDLSRQFTIGAQLDLDRSAFYAPTSLLFYARYLFDPVMGVPQNRPRPVQPYSSF